MQQSHLRYVVEFDIKGFFDNVDHSKLIKQMWALGIRDKRLIYIVKRILKAPIQLVENTLLYQPVPDTGDTQRTGFTWVTLLRNFFSPYSPWVVILGNVKNLLNQTNA